MMDCLCVVKVNINISGQRLTQLKSCGFCGGTGVLPSVGRKRVSYIMMNPVVEGGRPSYIMISTSEGDSGNDCTPSDVTFRSNGLDNADGTMTARYRINGGEWEDYSAEPYQGAYSLAKDFLSGLHWNDWRLFTDTNGGAAAFIFHYRNTGFSGVYERLEDNDSASEIVNPEVKITIDFQVTSGDEYDIVWMLFGEDTTVHSCAIANFVAV